MGLKQFSVIILCYRHFEYLFSAIDSVLIQDYPNIELIISDDASDNFPRSDLEEYINEHKGKNIQSVIIHQEGKNSGTVKHLNHVIPLCHGEYIAFLSGDDAYYDEGVLTSYVNGFSEAPVDCYIEMAYTGMYDADLGNITEYAPRPLIKETILNKKTDSSELLRLLLRYGAWMPTTSTCYRREFFERFGPYDERFSLVEDYPTHVRLAKEGWTIHYVDFVAYKHRDGGISHGQNDTLSNSARLYYTDEKNVWKLVIIPSSSALPKTDREEVRNRSKAMLNWVSYVLYGGQKNIGSLFRFALRKPGYAFFKLTEWFGNSKLRAAPLLLFCILAWPLAHLMANIWATAFGVPAAESLPVFQIIYAVAAIMCLAILLMKLYCAIRKYPDQVNRIG